MQTKIITRWALPRPGSSASQSKRRKRKADDPGNIATDPNASASEATTTTSNAPPSATLILKTYDPASGVNLMYRTDQAAEVGRLVAIMGTLGRTMTALPDEDVKDDTVTTAEASLGEQGTGTNTVPESAVGETKGKLGSGGGGQGGGKKRKKGKK